jgi:hypothetical protein
MNEVYGLWNDTWVSLAGLYSNRVKAEAARVRMIEEDIKQGLTKEESEEDWYVMRMVVN